MKMNANKNSIRDLIELAKIDLSIYLKNIRVDTPPPTNRTSPVVVACYFLPATWLQLASN